MPASASDFLQCAVDCVSSTESTEGPARSAVSRAYYAAYHDCLGWEQTLGFCGIEPPDLRGSHILLSSRLSSPHPMIAPNSKSLSRQRGYALRAFHTMRVVADYKLEQSVSLEDAHQAIADARRIMSITA